MERWIRVSPQPGDSISKETCAIFIAFSFFYDKFSERVNGVGIDAFQLVVAGAEKTCNNRKHVVHVFEIEFRDISCLQRQAIYLCDIVRQLDHFRINRVYTFSYNTFAIVSLYTAIYRCSFLSRNFPLLLFALILLQLPNRKAFFFISSWVHVEKEMESVACHP